LYSIALLASPTGAVMDRPFPGESEGIICRFGATHRRLNRGIRTKDGDVSRPKWRSDRRRDRSAASGARNLDLHWALHPWESRLGSMLMSAP
jgi:hypothetical protein